MTANTYPHDRLPDDHVVESKNGSKRRKALLMSGAAVAIVAAGMVGYAVADNSSSGDTHAAQPPAAAAAAGQSGGATAGHRMRGHGVAGTITAESGNTWTITGVNGAATTVTITPTTKFGSVKSPEQANQFAVGDAVVVRGTSSNGVVTASAIQTRRSGTTTATEPKQS